MPSNRTLNVLRAAAAYSPVTLRNLLIQCQKASDVSEKTAVYGALKEFLLPPGQSFEFRDDLGDEFQSLKDHEVEKAERKTNIMVNTCISFVKSYAEDGKMHNLINQLGISPKKKRFPEEYSPIESKAGLNEAVTILLGGLSATLKVDRSDNGILGIVTLHGYNQSRLYRRYNDENAFLWDRQKQLSDAITDLPSSHILRGLPLIYRDTKGQPIPA